MRGKLEVVALVLGFVGLVGTIAATAMPMWRVSAFIGANLIVMEDLWEGLWMNCWRQANIRMQCKMYESMLILPPELQAARGLMCVSIFLVVISLFVTGCGTRRSNCCGGDDMKNKNTTLALGGCLYLLSFLTTIIPVSWVGHTVITNFYDPLVVDGRKRELGSALFLGWTTSGVLLITGIIILFSYSRHRSKEEEPHHMVLRDVHKEDSVYLERTPSRLRDVHKEDSVYLERTPSRLRDVHKEDSVYLERTPSSSHKHHQYV